MQLMKIEQGLDFIQYRAEYNATASIAICPIHDELTRDKGGGEGKRMHVEEACPSLSLITAFFFSLSVV